MLQYRVSFIPKKGSRLTPKQEAGLESLFVAFVAAVEEAAVVMVSEGRKAAMEKVIAITDSIVSSCGLRTICAPEDGLKAAQRQVADQLQRFQPHPACHGFTNNRDALGCAKAHLAYWGRTERGLVILNMDAKDFFHSVSGTLVRESLLAHKLEPKAVAKILELSVIKPDRYLVTAAIRGLTHLADRSLRRNSVVSAQAVGTACGKLNEICTRHTRDSGAFALQVCRSLLSLGLRIHGGETFTPQGAPTSPMLSNLCMKMVDIRMTAMAKKGFGGYYTRYADDLTVSWPVPTKGKVIDGMYRCATLLLEEYGIRMNRKKKRVMGTGVRQDVVGYCVNAGRPTISQKLYRKDLRREIRGALRSGNIENLNLSRIQGQLAFVMTAHPREAIGLRRRIQGALIGRGPRNINEGMEPHDVTIDLAQSGGTDLDEGL